MFRATQPRNNNKLERANALLWLSPDARSSGDVAMMIIFMPLMMMNSRIMRKHSTEGESMRQARRGRTIIRPRRSRPITSIARYASELLEINFRKINSVYGGIENRKRKKSIKIMCFKCCCCHCWSMNAEMGVERIRRGNKINRKLFQDN